VLRGFDWDSDADLRYQLRNNPNTPEDIRVLLELSSL
jgi:hypothetical protein